MTEKKTITRRSSVNQASTLIESNQAWIAAIAGIVGGWLVLVGGVANALKLSDKHEAPWKNLLGTKSEKLFFAGIIFVAVGYPLIRFAKIDPKKVADVIEEKENGI